MRYFEIEFAHEPRNLEDWDGDIIGDYSICIIGERKPSLLEAAKFCKKDMEIMGYEYVVNVLEIPQKEAREFFDMEKEKDFPIFK